MRRSDVQSGAQTSPPTKGRAEEAVGAPSAAPVTQEPSSERVEVVENSLVLWTSPSTHLLVPRGAVHICWGNVPVADFRARGAGGGVKMQHKRGHTSRRRETFRLELECARVARQFRARGRLGARVRGEQARRARRRAALGRLGARALLAEARRGTAGPAGLAALCGGLGLGVRLRGRRDCSGRVRAHSGGRGHRGGARSRGRHELGWRRRVRRARERVDPRARFVFLSLSLSLRDDARVLCENPRYYPFTGSGARESFESLADARRRFAGLKFAAQQLPRRRRRRRNETDCCCDACFFESDDEADFENAQPRRSWFWVLLERVGRERRALAVSTTNEFEAEAVAIAVRRAAAAAAAKKSAAKKAAAACARAAAIQSRDLAKRGAKRANCLGDSVPLALRLVLQHGSAVIDDAGWRALGATFPPRRRRFFSLSLRLSPLEKPRRTRGVRVWRRSWIW